MVMFHSPKSAKLRQVPLEEGRYEGDTRLQRLYTAFPRGWPGAGLLLLRAAIGVSLLLQGGFSLSSRDSSGWSTWVVGLLLLAAGTSLLVGFMTPITGMLVGTGMAAVALSLVAAPSPNLFEAALSSFFAATIAVAIVVLGPGAFSLDALIFGRREIIIPRVPR
jgi:hypothetical protein